MRALRYALAFLVLVPTLACGVKSDPLPPLEEAPVKRPARASSSDQQQQNKKKEQ